VDLGLKNCPKCEIYLGSALMCVLSGIIFNSGRKICSACTVLVGMADELARRCFAGRAQLTNRLIISRNAF